MTVMVNKWRPTQRSLRLREFSFPTGIVARSAKATTGPGPPYWRVRWDTGAGAKSPGHTKPPADALESFCPWTRDRVAANQCGARARVTRVSRKNAKIESRDERTKNKKIIRRIFSELKGCDRPHRIRRAFRNHRVAMAVTAEEVVSLFEKAKVAAEGVDGNTASEDKAVDVLNVMAKMEIPLKLFITGDLGEVPKQLKRLAKKATNANVQSAAGKVIEAWKVIMTGGTAAGAKKGGMSKQSGGTGADEKKDDDAKEDAKDDTDDKDDKDFDEDADKTLSQLLGPSLGDPLRDRTRVLIAESLALCVGLEGVYASLKDCAQTGCAVERAMSNKWTDCGKEYKAKFR